MSMRRNLSRNTPLATLMLASLVAGCGETVQQRGAEADLGAGEVVETGSGNEAGTVAAQVGSFLDSYMEAVSARDTAALRGMYAEPDRFVWIEDGAVRYQDAGDIFASLAAFAPNATIDTEFDDLSVASFAGGGVHAWAPFTTSVSGEGGGYSFGGLMSFVLEPADGGWRIVGGHVSSPRSP